MWLKKKTKKTNSLIWEFYLKKKKKEVDMNHTCTVGFFKVVIMSDSESHFRVRTGQNIDEPL